jgi:predicted tellurium resistance membrane protein TerC
MKFDNVPHPTLSNHIQRYPTSSNSVKHHPTLFNQMSHELFSGAALISLLTLALLEIILGIDNVIFVSIIMGRMAPQDRKKARVLWMVFGIVTRSLLLLALGWLLQQKGKPLFTIPVIDKPLDLASLIMIGGGLFLLVKTERRKAQRPLASS